MDLDEDELKATRRLNGADICVGDYVRTKQGYIAKIEKIDNDFIHCDSSVYSNYGEESPLLPIDMKLLDGTHLRAIDYITKHSKNIIDLIEVGDYVNGYKVSYKESTLLFTDVKGIDRSGYHIPISQYGDNIEDIATKEQFSSMQYIVKEE